MVVRFDNNFLANAFSTDSCSNDFGITVIGDKTAMRFETNPWLPVACDNLIEIKSYGGLARHVTVEESYDAFEY